MTIQVDMILKNAVVLTMDEKFTQFEKGAVAISKDLIQAIGEETEILEKYSASEIIDCGNNYVLPGLINAHTHIPMTLLRGLADDLRLDVWLWGYMMPVEREFVSPEFVRLGAKIACAEQIRSGVTCFNDMYYFESDIALATAEAGMRAVCGETILKFPTPDASFYEESLAYARQFIIDWKDHHLITPAIAPHAPYTSTKEILQDCASLAVEYDVPLHIHLSETKLEVENSHAEHGMSVIPYVDQYKLFDAKVIAAHCVHIDKGEMRTLNQYGAGVAHNPSSNLKLASGIAPVIEMLKAELNVGIGTDGPGSNNDMDMFEEMRLASFIAKGSSGDPTVLPATTTLSMATRMGAKAIHLGEKTGSLEVGKQADLIVVDANKLHSSPSFKRDPQAAYARIIYSSNSSDVNDVMVAGKWLMKNRELLTLNETELLEEANDYAKKIDSFLIHREKSVQSKLIAIEGASQEESFEVQAKVKLDDPQLIIDAIANPEIEVLYTRHYHEYDTYFGFTDPNAGLLRYREDAFLNPDGEVQNVRYRLTLVAGSREAELPGGVVLSRSRYFAPATQSLRFYREYFQPSKETFIEKDRLRWRLIFKGLTFYINIDQFIDPQLGCFLEVKSRTWSQQDAEHKSLMMTSLLSALGVTAESSITQEYINMI